METGWAVCKTSSLPTVWFLKLWNQNQCYQDSTVVIEISVISSSLVKNKQKQKTKTRKATPIPSALLTVYFQIVNISSQSVSNALHGNGVENRCTCLPRNWLCLQPCMKHITGLHWRITNSSPISHQPDFMRITHAPSFCLCSSSGISELFLPLKGAKLGLLGFCHVFSETA